ncbi:MAG TPA: sigma-70 family RNA polymerase sigma factor [Planctomycetota bacterium]|jgi:RNA polymerase sigma factor for flagellar operon FliA|nr:sigma-70 family RNA polymerase sigma factor [Planctomycetota bacterium]
MDEGGWPGSRTAIPGASGRDPRRPEGGVPWAPLWECYVRTRRLALRNLLVESYLGLVRETLRHLRPPRGFDREDLESAGVFGLLRAVDRFDPDRGVRFETFAGRWVRGAILEEMRRADPWPRRWRERSARMESAIARLRDRHRREPTDEELAGGLSVSAERYRALYAGLRGRELFFLPRFLTEEETEGEEAPATDLEGPFEPLARRDLLDLALSLLDARERTILRLRYLEDRTLGEIGERVGLHASRVCRIHAEALARLRARLKSRAWEAA